MVLRLLSAAAVTAAMGPPVRALLERWRLQDEPNWRSSHTRPVPRGGGLAVAAGIIVGLLAAPEVGDRLLAGVLVVGLGLGIVGFADDVRRGVPAAVRLAATIAIVAVGLVVISPTAGWWSPLAAVIALGWIVAYVNAFNFMDGINGISSAQAVVGGVAIAAVGHQVGAPDVAVVAAVVAGAGLGFAPHNVPTARLFLGDVGAYLLGAVLALLVVATVSRGAPVEAATFAFLIYGADTAVTLGRRVARGDRWWDAHREHTYQRLVDAGWSHAATAGFVGAACSLTAALGFVSLHGGPAARAAAAGTAAVVVAAYLSTPALVAWRRTTARVPRTAPTPVPDTVGAGTG